MPGFGFAFGSLRRPRNAGGGGPAPWTPVDLGDALLDMFDFEDASTLSLTGNLINSITGKVSGLTLSQSVTASKPRYQETSSINGRPAGWADGIDDFLISPGIHAYVTGAAPLLMVALVANDEPGQDGGSRTIFSTSANSNASRRIQKAAGSAISKRPRSVTGSGSASTLLVNSNGPELGAAPRIVWAEFGASTTTLEAPDKNGEAVTASVVPAAAAGNVGIFAINATTQFWYGPINSVFLIDPLHANWSIENQIALMMWLNNRRGVQNPLYSAIDGHPLTSAVDGDFLYPIL